MLLDRLALFHDEWVVMAHKLGAKSHLAEDYVQEMYLRLYRFIDDPDSIMYGDEPNKMFVWVTLRNIIRTDQRKQKPHVELGSLEEPEPFDKQEALAFEWLVDKIYSTSEEMHWYNAKLFKIYFEGDLSMRDIASGSKISLKNIFETIKKTKGYVKEKLQEDYQDYKNQDYHHLKGFRRYSREDN